MERQSSVLSVVLWLSFAVGGQAVAAPILPGYDYLKAQPGTVWDFSSNQIEPQFFAPGSDPFDGQVAVITDTKVWRPSGTDFAGGEAVIPTEMVAMSLHSVEPIRVTYDGGMTESFFDVFVTLNPAPGKSLGQYALTHNGSGLPDGGFMTDSFFDVFFDVYFLIQFKPAEFSPPPDGNMDPRELERYQRLDLAALVPWSHTARAPYGRPDSGDFYLGMPPGGLTPQVVTFQGTEFTWNARLAAVPEPATLTLLGLGLLAFARRRRRK